MKTMSSRFKIILPTAVALAGLAVLWVAQAQSRKPVTITRLYTGPDGETHIDEVEVKFTGGTPTNQAAEMAKATGAQIHRSPPGDFQEFHTAPRRQYVITLSGRGELGTSDGHKVQLGPGQVLLVEDTTGKGHTTRALGNEDRVTIQIPLAN
jgi:quercetin dioxygenase-like cupin family protein